MKLLLTSSLVAEHILRWHSHAGKWLKGTLLILFGFSTMSSRIYHSAKQETPKVLISDRLMHRNANIAEEAKYVALMNIDLRVLSDSLAAKLATHASLIGKTEPELALKLIKEAYQITDQCPPAKVKQALAALFYGQLKHMPVLLQEFEIQIKPRKLVYSAAQQVYLIYMEDGQAMTWSSAMQLPKPYSVPDNGREQGLSNELVISPSKQLLFSISNQVNGSAYIKNQKGEIHGFFPAQEQISHASFGENDHRILTISTEGKCKLWALDGLSLRKENPWDSSQGSWGSGYPPFIQTKSGIELLNHKGETWRKLDLEIPADQIEVAMIGERMISFKRWGEILFYWDMEGRLLRRIKHEDRISAASISSDGNYGIVLTHEEPTSGRVYDLRTGQIYPALDTLLNDGLLVAAFSPAMPYMITHVDYGLTLGIWDTKGNKVKEFSPNGLVEMIYFSPKGRYFHTQADGMNGQVWDMEGNLLGTTDKNIKLLRFSPDESRIYYITSREDHPVEKTKKRSLPTQSFLEQYLLELLYLAPLTAAEKTRFGL